MHRLSESEWGQTQTLRHKIGAESEPELIFLLALDELLEQGSNWIRGWEEYSQHTGFPRPPRQVEGKRRLHLLRHTLAPERLSQPNYRDFPRSTGAQLDTLLQGDPATLPKRLSRMDSEVLRPQLAHLCCAEAAFLATSGKDLEPARQLLGLAELILQELSERRRGERSTLRVVQAEIDSVGGLITALQGQLDEALRLLRRAEDTLRTRRRLQCWGRGSDGTVQPPRRVHLPIRSHALWLSCSAATHAAYGYLDHARDLWLDAAELYFDISSFFAAGLQYRQLAQLAAWNGLPRQAAVRLDAALQVLDLRREPELRGRLSLELALLHLEAGNIVQGSQELELARTTPGSPRSGVEAAQGFLFLGMDNPKSARLWLQRARTSAAQEGADDMPAAQGIAETAQGCTLPLPRSLFAITLDLVELEAAMPWPRPDPARWLDDETSRAHLDGAPAELQRRWCALVPRLRDASAPSASIQQLRADLERWQHYPSCPWHAARDGCLWTTPDMPAPDAASLLVPTEVLPLPIRT